MAGGERSRAGDLPPVPVSGHSAAAQDQDEAGTEVHQAVTSEGEI